MVYKGDSGESVDPAISSVYFDNESFDLYNGRIEKKEGAVFFIVISGGDSIAMVWKMFQSRNLRREKNAS